MFDCRQRRCLDQIDHDGSGEHGQHSPAAEIILANTAGSLPSRARTRTCATASIALSNRRRRLRSPVALVRSAHVRTRKLADHIRRHCFPPSQGRGPDRLWQGPETISALFASGGVGVCVAALLRRCCVGDRIREGFGETIIAPVVHMEPVRRKECLEWHTIDVVKQRC